MREIKFRAWDTDNQKFIWIGFENFLSETHEDKPQDVRQGRMILNAGFSGMGARCIFQEYTSIKDKNGIEIYEGDIVKGVWYGKTLDKEIFGVVDFEEGMFGLTNKIDGESYSVNRVFVEVIGNIYENPELL